MAPFRFAVQAHNAANGTAWREQARRCEDLGYSTLFMPDHFGDQWAPLVALTSAMEATTTLRVGSLVLDNDYRHPLVLAKEIATLDLLSEGRVEFGLGAGWMRSDYEQSGMPYDEPKVRVDRFEEGLAVMKALWTQDTVDFQGGHYTMAGAIGRPKPWSSPHPPILIGGGGRRVLSIAAREADIVGVNANLRAGAVTPEMGRSVTVERYRERLEWIKEAAGDRFDRIELQCLTFFVHIVANAREVIEQLAPMFGVTPEEGAEVPLALVGTVDEICETIERRREELGLSYYVVHPPELETFAPIVERLTGK